MPDCTRTSTTDRVGTNSSAAAPTTSTDGTTPKRKTLPGTLPAVGVSYGGGVGAGFVFPRFDGDDRRPADAEREL